ncbi:hypothetical protein BDM02DRAFT_3106516 [Thelephora ganbajun]|uniref:Uncharacterized protein n=1 Tax=Thelephora ganbajun TaxID=370292 RepID=A0ACB6ZXL4_THEGA|nr:hypothetical protein BDM02DRAFT_3106516 [Thelephora ganbajun]
MATNSRNLHALQIIAHTSRKIRPKTRTVSTSRTTSSVPTVLEALPEHKPLLPLLLSHDVPSTIAKACADRYDRCASKLKSVTEAILVPRLTDHNKNQPAGIYSLFLNNYKQALWDWAQSILDAILKSLKRAPAKLRDWDIIYPPPLWFPFQRDPHSAIVPDNAQECCPLSYVSTPPHAFPTTYPPPLRPAAGLQPVQWLRTPAASSSLPPTPTIDLESLCLRFTKSLVIDENPMQHPQSRGSIFSPPIIRKEMDNTSRSRIKLLKSELSKVEHPRELLASNLTSTVSLLKTAKPRQLSVPPFPSFPKTKPTSRKASAPARVSTQKRAPVLSTSPALTCLTSSSSPLNTPTTGDLDIYTCPGTSTPLRPQPPPNPTLGQTTNTSQALPYSIDGPTTPPTLLPDLFSEPIVVPPTLVHLSPRSSPLPIADPFIQPQLHNDYLSDISLVSSFHYSGFTPGFVAGGLSSKSVFDTPLGSDHLFCDTPTPIASKTFESDFFNTYAVF